MRASTTKIRFAIDRGGTFTDVFALHAGRVHTEKLLSEDPAHYADAPREGIRRILSRITGEEIAASQIPTAQIEWLRMGTTVATNALLERRGAPCCLLITRGFKDLLRIGYQNRPDLFALNIVRPEQIYAEVVEIEERIRPVSAEDDPTDRRRVRGVDGNNFLVLTKPDVTTLRAQLATILARGIRSLAVVLMHGYSYHEHEKMIGALAREVGFTHVSLSHEVMPRSRIVARGDTTCVDAYLTPHIRDYLEGFRSGFSDQLATTELSFMQSAGGLVRAENFTGSSAILSGPAGGVVGYAMTTSRQLGNQPGNQPVIGFDMGGTSTDVSRYSGEYELVHESEIGGVRLQAPQLDIRTVAAGGGSRLFYRNAMLEVGPQSAGAHPGPACYRKDGPLTITDANLFLGRLHPSYFPAIFGPNENEPLDSEATRREFLQLTAEINAAARASHQRTLSPEEIALGFLEVASEVMARPMREISVMRGYNIREHVLACFGGAGGQHGCAIAKKLGIATIFIHHYSGILSAVGLACADVVRERREPAGARPLAASRTELRARLGQLSGQLEDELAREVGGSSPVRVSRYLNLRYQGTDTSYMIEEPPDQDFHRAFSALHRREYGFELPGRELLVDDLRVRAVAPGHTSLPPAQLATAVGEPATITRCYFTQGWRETPIYLHQQLALGQRIAGPALISQEGATIVIEPGCVAEIGATGIIIHVQHSEEGAVLAAVDPIQLALFSQRFSSIAEQMGRILQRTAISTNIKERCDFSCAIFDERGGLTANAPHVPVHLGAMSEAVRHQIRLRAGELRPGEVLLSNHPAAGGSHLPDLTVITPVWRGGEIRFFVASRGHHSDIGSISPGSMPPFSRSLDEEGLHLKSFTLVRGGLFQERELRDLMARISPPVRDPDAVIADLKAQIAANQRGIELLLELMESRGEEMVRAYMGHIQKNAENAVRTLLRQLAAQLPQQSGSCCLEAEDFLDDGSAIRLRLAIDPRSGSALFDFTGSGVEVHANHNAPPAVTQSAVLYALRCLLSQDIPLNQGCLAPITITLPPGSLLNPSEQAAVAGGNVLTSQRIVDVIFKALGSVAASQGCMNNLTFGNDSFGYYETIGGGAGAGRTFPGASGVHTHMTNTRITDPEIMEQRYPVMIRQFSLRPDSGGQGRYRGGDGLIREIEFLAPLRVAILSERRVFRPYGLAGGEMGAAGINLFLSNDGRIINLGGKNEISATPGDAVRILTPGGGGWGEKAASDD